MDRGACCRLLSMGSQRVGDNWATSLSSMYQLTKIGEKNQYLYIKECIKYRTLLRISFYLKVFIVCSVQFSHSELSDSLWPHELQQARLSCPSPAPRACSNLCPLSWWCHPTISSSVIPFSACLQSFPASHSFPMSHRFASGGQNFGASALAIVLPINIQDWFPLELTCSISLLSKGLSRVFSNTTVQKYQFFSTQRSLWSKSHIHTWLLEKPWLWLDGPLLAK